MEENMFISFEGVDGSGKSTQARLLAEYLRKSGREVVLTREPGGSVGAEEIRNLVITGASDRWSAETEILLFTAARRDHLEKTIMPAIKDGKTVITDRFADSTRVYQGAAGPRLLQITNQLHDLMIKTEPDLTILLDFDPEIALARSKARLGSAGSNEDRFEERGLAFQKGLRAGFLALADNSPERFRVIDARGDMEQVRHLVESAVSHELARGYTAESRVQEPAESPAP